MYRRWLLCVLVLTLLLGVTSPAAPKEALVDQVRDGIRRGVQYLRDKQVVSDDGKGHWELAPELFMLKGGETSLALLALLNSGVKPDDLAVERGLNYLRGLPLQDDSWTYSVSLQTMVFAVAGHARDRERVQRNVEWLIKARVMSGERLLGWTYKQPRGVDNPDNSNTQYALLGLHEA